MKSLLTPRACLTLALGLALPTARADVGSAIGSSIGQSLPQYRTFQHARRPTLLETSRDVVRVPASRVLGLVEITLAGPRAGATRTVGGRGIGLEVLPGAPSVGATTESTPSAPGAPVSAAFAVRSSTACAEPAACVPYTPPVRDVLLVPAVTANTLAGTPIARNGRADGRTLGLSPEPEAASVKSFTPAEAAALPAVPDARALLPYGFATQDGVVRVAFRLSGAPAPGDDLTVVFAILDTTVR